MVKKLTLPKLDFSPFLSVSCAKKVSLTLFGLFPHLLVGLLLQGGLASRPAPDPPPPGPPRDHLGSKKPSLFPGTRNNRGNFSEGFHACISVLENFFALQKHPFRTWKFSMESWKNCEKPTSANQSRITSLVFCHVRPSVLASLETILERFSATRIS